jgi:hypothetical protein
MKNSWKGLAVGGLTGALVGIVIDVFTKALQEAVHGAELARGRAPEAAEWLASMTHRASEWAADVDVPDRMRQVGQHLGESDLASKAGAAASKVAGTTLHKARSSMGHA